MRKKTGGFRRLFLWIQRRFLHITSLRNDGVFPDSAEKTGPFSAKALIFADLCAHFRRLVRESDVSAEVFADAHRAEGGRAEPLAAAVRAERQAVRVRVIAIGVDLAHLRALREDAAALLLRIAAKDRRHDDAQPVPVVVRIRGEEHVLILKRALVARARVRRLDLPGDRVIDLHHLRVVPGAVTELLALDERDAIDAIEQTNASNKSETFFILLNVKLIY